MQKKAPTPLAKQIASLFSENQSEKQASLNYFLGRGPGLTPSGDDFLLGWLFINQLVFGSTKNDQLILEKHKVRTTQRMSVGTICIKHLKRDIVRTYFI